MRFKPVSNGKWNGMELYKHAIYSIVQMTGHLTLVEEGRRNMEDCGNAHKD
jgi:hypothetical protein